MKYNVDIYADDIFIKTITVQAVDAEDAEEQVKEKISLEFSVEEADV